MPLTKARLLKHDFPVHGFCALLQTRVYALLRSFAPFCAHLRVSASDRISSDRVWELQSQGSGWVVWVLFRPAFRVKY